MVHGECRKPYIGGGSDDVVTPDSPAGAYAVDYYNHILHYIPHVADNRYDFPALLQAQYVQYVHTTAIDSATIDSGSTGSIVAVDGPLVSIATGAAAQEILIEVDIVDVDNVEFTAEFAFGQ